GPPPEIESHPSGDTVERPFEQGGGVSKTYPYEIWRYTSLPTFGDDVHITFVDQSGKGDYKMVSIHGAAARKELQARPGTWPPK
ncbi:MAG TPA: hypothetical protein VER03_26300, partial [Bryobacteraceae bacterium]|nr:hypothetical protein [Bryobacteraceae bacterium]